MDSQLGATSINIYLSELRAHLSGVVSLEGRSYQFLAGAFFWEHVESFLEVAKWLEEKCYEAVRMIRI